MFIPRPSREEFRHLARKGNLIPVLADFFADLETPVSAYAKLAASRPAFLFESVEGGENASRYSFLGCNPRKVFEAREETTVIRERGGRVREIPTPADPLRMIEEEIARFQPVEIEGLPPFVGGAVGFLSYEYIHRIEPTVPRAAEDHLDCPLLYYAMIDSLVIFDRAHQKLLLCATVAVGEGEDPDVAYDRAVAELKTLADLLAAPTPGSLRPVPAEPAFAVPPGNFERADFERAVEECREYVCAGDVVQVVLSQRFRKEYRHSPTDLYRTLRTINPSPYMFILETEDFAVVGASPEVHVRLTGDRVEIRPIAGTRPRGRDSDADLRSRGGFAGRSQGARGAPHARRSRPERHRTGLRAGQRPRARFHVDRAVFPRHAYRFPGRRSPRRGRECLRSHAGHFSGGNRQRGTQSAGDADHRRKGGDDPGSLFGRARLFFLRRKPRFVHRDPLRPHPRRRGFRAVRSGPGRRFGSEKEFEETINKARGLLKAVAISEIVEDEHPKSSSNPTATRKPF